MENRSYNSEIERSYRIVIEFTTSESDYTCTNGESNLIDDIVERIGCLPSDIVIHYINK